MKLEEALEAYKEKFDDVYPLYCTMGMSDEETAEDVERCIESGEPFDGYEEGAVY